MEHLESISASLDIAQKEDDLVQIREELIESGYLHRKGGGRAKKVKITSVPFHYISSDGYDIYVGKNNYQNDDLTFRFASGGDWWFHAKGIPGSHVVVKTKGAELPDATFEDAARLAAYYSRGRGQRKGRGGLYGKEEREKTRRRKARLCGLLYQLLHDDRFRYQRPETGGMTGIAAFSRLNGAEHAKGPPKEDKEIF